MLEASLRRQIAAGRRPIGTSRHPGAVQYFGRFPSERTLS
jgi:hypothetical protein